MRALKPQHGNPYGFDVQVTTQAREGIETNPRVLGADPLVVTTQAREGIETLIRHNESYISPVTTQAREGIETKRQSENGT